ncbi:MAG: TetR/AcrR family transcriptional regulator [Candidatus Syntrophonatronum acetioxidans]|uniref:TetR/AcrR family transcriptional regulator n=1 Tax=Candidatus Syntrophonatronum acetioxidans TaxID=1795816 RepID=A0A424YE77_9FIRM|nr:MAG: TetR/AcrR family transcriptional regulator [Candidatus Syntrophonatronum acetioxidans]
MMEALQLEDDSLLQTGIAKILEGVLLDSGGHAKMYVSPYLHSLSGRGEGKMSKGRDSREKILEKARQLFAQKGYQGTSVAEIASAAGFSEGAIYRHFESKEALLMECIRPLMKKGVEIMEGEGPESQDLHQFMRCRVEKRLEMFTENYDSFKILFTEAYYRPNLMQMLIDSLSQEDHTKEATEKLFSFKEIKIRRNYLIIALSQALALWGVIHLKNLSQGLQGKVPEALSRISHEHLVEDMTVFLMYGLAGIPPDLGEKKDYNKEEFEEKGEEDNQ